MKWYLLVLLVIFIGLSAQAEEKYPVWPKAVGSDTNSCHALSEVSAQYTLPVIGDFYYIIAKGNTAYILEGTNPTATASPNGHTIPVSDGMIFGPVRLTGPKVAYIGDTGAGTAGEVCFLRLHN